MEDNMNQMKWCRLMQPMKAILKFRLPYYAGQTMYLKGKCLLPIWGPQSTSETRLIPSCDFESTDEADIEDSMIEYDHTKYEDQMFYFNKRIRVGYYDHEEIDGYDHCFDCTAEIIVIKL